MIAASAKMASYNNGGDFVNSISSAIKGSDFTFDGLDTITDNTTGKQYKIDSNYNVEPYSVIPIYSKEELEQIGNGQTVAISEEGGRQYTFTEDGDYILKNNIDLSGDEFTPISTLSGTFDGKNYSIDGMTISNATYPALFSYLDGGTVKNLALTNVNITANVMVGTICRYADNNSIVENCFVTGTISTSSAYIGGISGALINSSIIRNCYTTCDISAGSSGGWSGAGGIVRICWMG